MVAISAPPGLSKDGLSLFYTVEASLANAPILVFYGATSSIPITTNSTSLRIQSHVFTPAGLQSFHRLVVAPNSPFYEAVTHLSREEQGDEVCRAIAFSLFKYFSELPNALKRTWITRTSKQRPSSESKLFTPAHAAELASRMFKIPNAKSVIKDIETALATQSVSNIDVDLILPSNAINKTCQSRSSSLSTGEPTFEDSTTRYGKYAKLVDLFGDQTFVPSAKVRRAPSRATTFNKSEHFSRAQKENLRREMCELVDTEENYLSKIHDLVHGVAADLRKKGRLQATYSASVDEAVLKSLFPPSLDQILQTNTEFYQAIRELLEGTENEAIEDIQTTLDSSVPQVQLSFDTSDHTGSLAIANCLVTCFPQFQECYGNYILAQQEFIHVLRSSMRDRTSLLTRHIQEIGEQRIMSMLIEPVQRLPRYSLYIDNIIKQLPAKHLAIKPFLKAKNIIAGICSQDSIFTQHSRLLENLRHLIPSWPSAFRPEGRLITATDVDDVKAPFSPKAHPQGNKPSILILFAGSLVILEKASAGAISARGLLAEVENPNLTGAVSQGRPHDHHSGLIFTQGHSLMQIDFVEMSSDTLLRLNPLSVSSQTKSHIRSFGAAMLDKVIILYLGGAFEAKVSCFIKDIILARIEGRFTETLRGNGNWEIRSTELEKLYVGLSAAVFEETSERTEQSTNFPAPIRISIGAADMGHEFTNKEGVDVAVSVSDRGEGFYCFEIDALNERRSRDIVTSTEFLPVLTKRIGNIMQLRNTIRNPLLTAYLLQHNEDILQSLQLERPQDQPNTVVQRSLRAPSPVKMLSNLFGGATLKDAIHPTVAPRLLFSKDIPQLPPPLPPKVTIIQPDPALANVSHVLDTKFETSADHFASLEQTMASYVLALRARQGNVVGRVVASRALANEAAVNDLYNSLLENPSNHERSAQAPIDVLFASFENFLNNAWKDKFGAVIDASTLTQLQLKLGTLGPLDYEEHMTEALRSGSPQNRRALEGILGLFADLMKGTGNDADRGALTAALAEMIVREPKSHDFIPIFDHLMSEREAVFGHFQPGTGPSSVQNSLSSSVKNSTSNNTGSFGSKASSLSRRLGFGSLRRENSTIDHSKNVSALRAWSKTTLSADNPDSRSNIVRTKSVDLGGGNMHGQQRAHFRDRTQMADLSEQAEDDPPKTGRSLDTMDQSPSKDNQSLAALKKKRRSSLSDLNELLQKPGATPVWMSSRPKAIPRVQQLSPSSLQVPTTLLKATEATMPAPLKAKEITVSARPTSVSRLPSEPKESQVTLGSRLPTIPRPRPTVIEQSISDPFGWGSEVTGLAVAGKPSTKSPSGIPRHYRVPSNMPNSKGVLSERTNLGNTPPPPPVPTKSPKNMPENVSPIKPHLSQSPSKLRERLQAQQNTITTTSTSLQAEIDKIGEELSLLRVDKLPIQSATHTSASGSPQKREQQNISNLGTRLRALETKIPHLIGNLERQASTLETDYDSALQCSHRHVRGLEAKLREATVENQTLYGRCERELEGVFAQVNKGEGGDAMQAKLKEALHEASRWRRQAQKLAKENLELKALCGRE